MLVWLIAVGVLSPREVRQPMVICEAQRLYLREFTLTDTDAMERVFGDAEVMHFGSDGVRTAEWVRDWLAGCVEDYDRQPGVGPLAVVERASSRTMGYCGVWNVPDIGGQSEWEVGYRLATPYWRQGYATEAAHAVRDHAFTALGLRRLIAVIDPGNIASVQVAKKIGLRYEKEVTLAGYDHPDHVYAVNI